MGEIYDEITQPSVFLLLDIWRAIELAENECLPRTGQITVVFHFNDVSILVNISYVYVKM